MTRTRTIVYPGSFDPVTNGHLDIVCRACKIFDHVIVAVTRNSAKSHLFTVGERLDMLNTVLASVIKSGKVRVDSFDGLLADYCRKQGAQAVARGLRALSDFEYEFQMALMNRHLAPELETVFLMADEKYTYLSSSLLKDVVRLGGDAWRFVPPALVDRLKKKLRWKKGQ
ncbi:MAG: pantetheine-phosphate adenylyltransferase [Elusimicrobia bacterium]|nr:pantetheine-phosphate adenylyltransferase [Elusimicrobiota bacterium]